MQFQLFQVNAFTDKLFSGNPACVVPLTEWLPDELMIKIARENAVPETAFFIRGKNTTALRWFTPEIEIDLCGHATLATAHVIKTILQEPGDRIIFETQSGDLTVTMQGDLYILDFPSRKPEKSTLPDIIKNAISIQPEEILKSRDYILVYESEEDVRNIVINRQILDQMNLDPGGMIITAPGRTGCDFVSRYFTPQASIFEDPVTGSAHCSLIPYWSHRLHKTTLKARQLSERGGTLFCTDHGTRVLIAGHARTYSLGTIRTD